MLRFLSLLIGGKGDLPLTIVDNSLMKSILDWEPKSSLEEMCKDGLNWELNKMN